MASYVTTWGSNDNNQLDLPFKFPNSGQNPYLTSGNFEATKISVGYDHAIGFIKSSGITFLTGWGGNNYRQTYVADKNFYYIDCEAGIETTYLLDSAFRIHGFGKDLMESDVGLATGTIINWNYIYDNKSWPQGYSAYPRRFRQLSAGSGYLLAIDSNSKITGWGKQVERITGSTVTGILRTGAGGGLIFNATLNSGSYVTVNFTGASNGAKLYTVWRQSSNNLTYKDLILYNSGIPYTSGRFLSDGGLGNAAYSGYLDLDSNYFRVILSGSGSVGAGGNPWVRITGYSGINWQNPLKVIDYSGISQINSGNTFIDISAGYNHAIALISGSGGFITGWGDNSFGQLGFDRDYFSGAKVETKAGHSHAIGYKKPIITRMSGNNPISLFYDGTGRRVTGLQLQIEINANDSFLQTVYPGNESTLSPDAYGKSIAINNTGNILVLGANANTVSGGLIFTGNFDKYDNFVFKQFITGSNSTVHGFGRSIDISSDGRVIVMGGPAYNIPSANYGAAVIYTGNINNGWVLKQFLTGGNSVSNFGTSVATNEDGSIIVIGCPRDNSFTGSAMIFTGNPSASWNFKQKISGIKDGTGGAPRFGTSVDISNKDNSNEFTIVIGGPIDNLQNGSAMVCTGPINGNFEFINKIYGVNAGEFGTSVAISNNGEIIVMGGPKDNDRGAIQIYGGVSNNLYFKKKIYGNGGSYRFGSSVDINYDGNIIIVGDPLYYSGGISSIGRATILTGYQNLNWGIRNTIEGSNSDQAGTAVAVNTGGNIFGIGIPNLDRPGSGISDNAGGAIVSYYPFLQTGWIQPTGTGYLRTGTALNNAQRILSGFEPINFSNNRYYNYRLLGLVSGGQIYTGTPISYSRSLGISNLPNYCIYSWGDTVTYQLTGRRAAGIIEDTSLDPGVGGFGYVEFIAINTGECGNLITLDFSSFPLKTISNAIAIWNTNNPLNQVSGIGSFEKLYQIPSGWTYDEFSPSTWSASNGDNPKIISINKSPSYLNSSITDNFNFLDIEAGYKTVLTLNKEPLATGTPALTSAFQNEPEIFIPVSCSNIIYDH